MSCKGEPAGRGRFIRGSWALGLSLFGIVLLFLICAPLAVRLNASLGGGGWTPVAAADGSSVCMVDYSYRATTAWIVDLEDKKRLRFLPPPVWDVAWNRDGDRLAVMHSAGALGRLRSEWVIDFFDQSGDRIAERIYLGEQSVWLDDMRWDGERLVSRLGGGPAGSAVVIISSRTGSVDRVELPENWWKWWLIGPTASGEFFIYRLMDEEARRYALHGLDLENALLDPEPLLVEEGYSTFSGKWISPSGRYWLRHLGDAEAGLQITDLENGDAYPLPECRRALWLDDDRLVCLEEGEQSQSLTIGLPGEQRKIVREWDDSLLALELSPDRANLLIQIWKPEGEWDEAAGFWSQGMWWKTSGRLRELWILEPASGALQDASALVADLDERRPAAIRWAGRETLALTGPGRLALADLDGGGGWRYITGEP
jgi:hypothetical protein